MSVQRLLIHSVRVTRMEITLDQSVPNQARRKESWTTVYDPTPARVEPMTRWERDSIVGRLDKAQFKMMVGAIDLREGDRVTWLGIGHDKVFIVRDLIDDTGRRTNQLKTARLEAADIKGSMTP